VNKTALIDQLTELLDGNKKSAQTAVESIIDAIQREVQKGQNVSVAGFGVFEKWSGPPEPLAILGPARRSRKTTVPAFRPGTVVLGQRRVLSARNQDNPTSASAPDGLRRSSMMRQPMGAIGDHR
jgi:hypothetical protein